MTQHKKPLANITVVYTVYGVVALTLAALEVSITPLIVLTGLAFGRIAVTALGSYLHWRYPDQLERSMTPAQRRFSRQWDAIPYIYASVFVTTSAKLALTAYAASLDPVAGAASMLWWAAGRVRIIVNYNEATYYPKFVRAGSPSETLEERIAWLKLLSRTTLTELPLVLLGLAAVAAPPKLVLLGVASLVVAYAASLALQYGRRREGVIRRQKWSGDLSAVFWLVSLFAAVWVLDPPSQAVYLPIALSVRGASLLIGSAIESAITAADAPQGE
jgi:hypothetical protein